MAIGTADMPHRSEFPTTDTKRFCIFLAICDIGFSQFLALPPDRAAAFAAEFNLNPSTIGAAVAQLRRMRSNRTERIHQRATGAQ